ncbi:MAG: hypothetical protein KIT10_11415 [Flavobacteriales bacterium]|nr:hypothetical protein [Flavobacteriales bacterium]
MERSATILRTSSDGKRCIAVDNEVFDEVLAYIGQDARHKNKFIDIVNVILAGLKNRDLYDKENIDASCKDVTAMKFFKGQENDRIYCKEIRRGDKTMIVIMGALLERKKTTENSKRELATIRNVGTYTYPDHKIHERRPPKSPR